MRKKREIKIDVGCGPNKKKGYIGIDLIKQPGVDLVVDLEKKRLPFKNSSVDRIYCSHFLEHVSNPSDILAEFARVLKDKGELKIIVPHYSNPYSYHFTHRTYWSYFSLNQEYLDYYLSSKLDLMSVKIKIVLIPKIDLILTKIVNLFPALYERIFSYILKAWEVEFTLIKNESKSEFKKIK